jgi:hypothetical protein
MTAATQDRTSEAYQGEIAAHGVAAATRIFLGTLVNKNAAGYAVPATDTAGETSLGVSFEGVDNRLGADGDLLVRCERNRIVVFDIAAVARTDVNRSVYVSDDKTVAFTGNVKVGTIAKFVEGETTRAYVDLDSGVALSTTPHGATHAFGGTDPMPGGSSAPPDIAAAGAVGTASGSAREDHTHGHGTQTDPTMHAVATAGADGFMASADKAAHDSLVSLGLAAHAARHENGGIDEIDVGGLSGVLADPQTPILHASAHQTGGADAIPLATNAPLDGLMPGVDKALIDALKTASGNLAFVSKTGDDAAAELQNAARPYLTLGAAMAAADAAGGSWMVIFGPGTYVENLTHYDNVSIMGEDQLACIVQHTVAAGKEYAMTMAENMGAYNFTLDGPADAGADSVALGWPGTSYMTSKVRHVRILGQGAGDHWAAEFLNAGGQADVSHYCMEHVSARLNSETDARGIKGVGDESTFHAHMKDCVIEVVGAGGYALEVIGKISAPGCSFIGDAGDVLLDEPKLDNVLRYDSATSFTALDMGAGAGGSLERMGGFDHALASGDLYVDDLFGDDKSGEAGDPSRPFKTTNQALSVAAPGQRVVVTPGIYAESITVPVGVLLYAPGCSFTAVTVADGAAAVLDESLIVDPKAAGPVAPVLLDSGKLYTDEGSAGQIVVNLPAARPGLSYEFAIQAGNGFQINANGTDTIRDGATVSAAGGNIASVTAGDFCRLASINGSEWFAVPAVGTWTVT